MVITFNQKCNNITPHREKMTLHESYLSKRMLWVSVNGLVQKSRQCIFISFLKRVWFLNWTRGPWVTSLTQETSLRPSFVKTWIAFIECLYQVWCHWLIDFGEEDFKMFTIFFFINLVIIFPFKRLWLSFE